jgi:hypothetical protein
MPFKSKAQQKFMYATSPKVAKKMAGETPMSAYKTMPEYAKKKKKKGMSSMLEALREMSK